MLHHTYRNSENHRISATGDVVFTALPEPDTVGDLFMWLRGDSGITEVSGGVDVWADKTSNAHNVIAPSAGDRPTLILADSNFNNQDSVSFDGSDFLTTDSNGAGDGDISVGDTKTETTMLVVWRSTTSNSPAGYLINTRTGSDGFNLLLTPIAYEIRGRASGGAISVEVISDDYTDGIVRLTATSQKVGGGESDGLRHYAEGVLTHNESLALGDGFVDGGSVNFASRDITSFFPGTVEIAEVIIYTRQLIDSELNTLFEYLGERYNIAVSTL